MKKIYKILFLLIFIFAIFCIINNVKANSIKKISMDIYVDDYGNAEVTETWDCSASKGTEVYHPYYNLGKSQITNLTVSENEKNYETLSSWNTSGSLSSKAYKCGINKISNGVELCWGISKYGSHTYTVKYRISNFVSNLTDSQIIYWTLIPYDFSESIGTAYIKIHTNFDISDTTDVWGYGNYGGTCYVYNGYIEMQSDGRLNKDEYMTILVKFPSGTFKTESNLNHDFNYYYKMAQEGATTYKQKTTFDFIKTIIMILMSSWPLLLIIIVAVISSLTKTKYEFGPNGKKFTKDIPYFRDIPCNGNLFKAYYIAYKYGIITKKTDLLGAIILKWIKDSLIRLEQREGGKVFKKEETVIILNETDTSLITDTYERKLFNMLYDASKDGILENKEFERWCKDSYRKILNWFDDIIEDQQTILIREGLITLEETKKLGIFTSKTYKYSEELRKDAEQLYGLKRYLLEYTLIPDREPLQVHIFEEYLIYAQMMGIAKEVAKEFKDLYPDIIEQSHYYSYDYILFVHMYSSNAVDAASSRAQSYSSGGGGFSSGGGGGGSFGGGGGGGGFR